MNKFSNAEEKSRKRTNAFISAGIQDDENIKDLNKNNNRKSKQKKENDETKNEDINALEENQILVEDNNKDTSAANIHNSKEEKIPIEDNKENIKNSNPSIEENKDLNNSIPTPIMDENKDLNNNISSSIANEDESKNTNSNLNTLENKGTEVVENKTNTNKDSQINNDNQIIIDTKDETNNENKDIVTGEIQIESKSIPTNTTPIAVPTTVNEAPTKNNIQDIMTLNVRDESYNEKKYVNFYLRKSIIQKIDKLAGKGRGKTGYNKSELVDMMLEKALEVMKFNGLNKK